MCKYDIEMITLYVFGLIEVMVLYELITAM